MSESDVELTPRTLSFLSLLAHPRCLGPVSVSLARHLAGSVPAPCAPHHSRSAPLTFLLTLSSPRPLLLPRSRPSSPASSSSRTLLLPPSPLTVTLASSGSSRAQHGPHHPLPTTSPRLPCDPSSDHHVPQRSPRSARTRGRLAIQLRPLTPPLWLLPAARVRASRGPDRLGSDPDRARKTVVSVGDSLRGGRLGEF